MAATPQKFRRRWRNFLLDRRYQLRYAAVMASIAGLLTAGLGAGILRQTREVAEESQKLAAKAQEASKIVELQELGNPDDPTVKEIKKAFAESDEVYKRQARAAERQARFVPYALFAFFFLLTIAMALYAIVMTHRVAGPLFKIANYLKRMTDNRFTEIYDLRKGDELQDFFATFKQAYNAVKARTKEDAEQLATVTQAAEALAARHPELSTELEPILLELRGMVEDKRRALE